MSPTFSAISRAMSSTLSAIRSVKGAELGPHFAQAAADVKLAENAIDQMNRELQETPAATQRAGDGFTVMRGVAVSVLTSIGRAAKDAVGGVIGLTDELTGSTARLNLIAQEGESVAAMQESIFQAAQRSRGSYLDMVDSVSKLKLLTGDTFANTAEATAYAELLNKQFVIGGADASSMAGATRQITQALGSGRLQGDEFVSVMENAPLYAQAIAKYLNLSIGELKELSSQGVITSDILKGAMFSVAEETNARFAEMPMTIAQIWTSVSNVMLKTFMPVLQGIGEGAQFIYENWEAIEPVFVGVAAGIGVATGAWAIYTAATWLAVAANQVLIVSMLTNPFFLIGVGIGIIVGLIYKWVQSVGGIEIAWIMAMDGIYNAVSWLKQGVAILFQEIVNGAIININRLIGLINMLPGVEIQAIAKVQFGTEIGLAEEAKRQGRAAESAGLIADIQARNLAAAGGGAGFDWDALTTSAGGGKALNVKNTDPIKIDGEDIKMLLDISTGIYQPIYAQLTPQISLNIDTVRESADMNQVLEVVADWVTEAAETRLN